MRWFGFGAWWLQSERPPQDVSTIPNTTVTQIRFFQETCSLVFRKSVVPPVSHANQSENLEEPEEDSHPIEDPEVALQRSRHGRTLKPRRDPILTIVVHFLIRAHRLTQVIYMVLILHLLSYLLRSFPTLTRIRRL